MVNEITEDNLAQFIADNENVFVQYSAGWCGNCRIMKPKFKLMSNDHEEALFLIVDAEKFPESRKLANVDNLPTFAAFKNGQLAGQVQTNKADVLKTFIDETSAN
jgi:thiol-disulfide isomerase/thioredoxin